jgi:hypothetical protein
MKCVEARGAPREGPGAGSLCCVERPAVSMLGLYAHVGPLRDHSGQTGQGLCGAQSCRGRAGCPGDVGLPEAGLEVAWLLWSGQQPRVNE